MPIKPTQHEISALKREVKRLRAIIDERTPPLAVLLRRRGFSIYKREPVEDLLIPAKRYRDAFYAMLDKYSFRLFLRDVIKHQDLFRLEDVARYATARVTGRYIDFLRAFRLLRKTPKGFILARRPVTSFGPTLEWYIAEMFRREFGAETVWGVKFKRPRVGGDYDVIARFEGSLLYGEVKSSPPKQIYDSEIDAFLDRVEDLAPELALFLMDTELRMKDKIVPMFEAALAKRTAYPPPVMRLERELFGIDGRVFIVNAKENIAQNLESVLSRYYRKGILNTPR